MSLLGGIELAPLSVAFKVDIKGFKSDMDKVKTEAVTKSKEVKARLYYDKNIDSTDCRCRYCNNENGSRL